MHGDHAVGGVAFSDVAQQAVDRRKGPDAIAACPIDLAVALAGRADQVELDAPAGASVHPGGGVHGVSGHAAARALLADGSPLRFWRHRTRHAHPS